MLELFLSISEPLSCARGCSVTLDVHTRVLHLLIDCWHKWRVRNAAPPGYQNPWDGTERVRDSSCLKQDMEKCPSAEPGAGKFLLLLLLLLGGFSLELEFGEHSSGFKL